MADEEEKKTPAQLAREKIEVVSSENNNDDDNENDNEKKSEEENNEEVKEEEKKEEEVEAKKSEDEEEEVEEKEDDPEKLKKTIERLKRRIGTKTNSEKELAKELADAKAKLAKLEEEGTNTLTEEDVETRAEEKARIKREQEKFDETCNKLAEEAEKIDKNFQNKVTELGEDYGKIPPVMIDVLGEINNGGAVLNYLCDNPEEYEKIRILKPGRMAVKLNEIAETIKPKKTNKEVSKVPPPIKAVKPSAQSENGTITITGKEDMAEFVRKRKLMEERKRQARG